MKEEQFSHHHGVVKCKYVPGQPVLVKIAATVKKNGSKDTLYVTLEMLHRMWILSLQSGFNM